MQRAIKSVGVIVLGLVFGGIFLGIYGCGGSDALDEVGQRYLGDISFADADEDGVLTIDTVWNLCGEGEDVVEEIFTDTFADITIQVTEGAPGLSLQSYSISYTPLESPDGSGGTTLPPTLVSPGREYYSLDIPTSSTVTFTLPALSIDTKNEFAIKMGWLDEDAWEYSGLPPAPSELFVASYRIRLVLHFEDVYGVDRDITFERTVYLSGYNNC